MGVFGVCLIIVGFALQSVQYWLALLDGLLANCPPVTYIGQTIRVTSFEVLPPLVEQLTESTPEIGIGSLIKPESTPAN